MTASGRRWWLRVTLLTYVVVLAVVGFWPQPVDKGVYSTLQRLITWCDSHGLVFVSYARIQFGANILLFVPLGLIIALLFGRRRWWMAPLICCLASAFIEVGQGTFLPHRVESLGDFVSNSFGGLVGTAVALAILFPWARTNRTRKVED
jgi:glycopeptide antibiotics resistance protein